MDTGGPNGLLGRSPTGASGYDAIPHRKPSGADGLVETRGAGLAAVA